MLSAIFCDLVFCFPLFWGTFYEKGSVAQAINCHCDFFEKEQENVQQSAFSQVKNCEWKTKVFSLF